MFLYSKPAVFFNNATTCMEFLGSGSIGENVILTIKEYLVAALEEALMSLCLTNWYKGVGGAS